MLFVYSCKDSGILVDTEFKFHGHIRSIVGKSSGMSVNLLNSMLCRSREFLLTLYIIHIRPSLVFVSCVWNLEYIWDMKMLENMQKRWTKRIDSFENLIYSQRVKDLDLFSVEGMLLRADVIKCWKIFRSKSEICPEDIFVFARSGITRGHRYEIAHKIF